MLAYLNIFFYTHVSGLSVFPCFIFFSDLKTSQCALVALSHSIRITAVTVTPLAASHFL